MQHKARSSTRRKGDPLRHERRGNPAYPPQAGESDRRRSEPPREREQQPGHESDEHDEGAEAGDQDPGGRFSWSETEEQEDTEEQAGK